MVSLPKLIEPELLAQHLENDALLIVDLCNEQRYQQYHIPGALHVSPSELLAGTPPATGRLPDISRLNQLFSRLGLTPETHVIAYDDEGGGWAGRLIWTLEALGHHNWSYLNGGMVAWKNEGFPVDDTIAPRQPCPFDGQINTAPVAEISDILTAIENHSAVIWDARSAAEYQGIRVLAERGGHIPGAVHCEWTELMDPARNLRIREDALDYLAEKGITKDSPVITHCQTHHRSGFTYLAGLLLGFDIKGYHGSWSEWGNQADTPIEISA